MSLELLDPFWLQAIPDTINETIDNDFPIPLPYGHPVGSHLTSSSTATTTTDVGTPALAFNQTGLYLAAGRQDGAVIVWDFESKSIGGPARCLVGHVREITSISWSPSGRRLLTTGADNLAIFWDLKGKELGGRREFTVRCETPVLGGALSPREESVFVIALQQARPRLYRSRADHRPTFQELAVDNGTLDGKEQDEGEAKISKQVTVVQFSARGNIIYGGTSRGEIIAWDALSAAILWVQKLAGSSAIRQLRLDALGKGMITNSSDRIVRHYQFEQHEDDSHRSRQIDPVSPPLLVNKFQDLVNRISWSDVGFSPNGDYIYGGSDEKGSHSFYFWDTTPLTGGLVRIIEGLREPLEAVAWHPTRPVMASVGTSGLINIYQAQKEEEWSAFAPEFVELEDNVEYREREDEFDIIDVEAVRRKQEDEEESVIDIGLEKHVPSNASMTLTDDEDAYWCGSYCIPVSPQPESAEEQLLGTLEVNGEGHLIKDEMDLENGIEGSESE